MLLYFEFQHRRFKADVQWSRRQSDPIIVNITDKQLLRDLPSDLHFETDDNNRVVFTIEDKDNKRLTELQEVLAHRLQEFVNKS